MRLKGHTEPTRRRLRALPLELRALIRWVPEDGDAGELGNRFLEQLQLLANQLRRDPPGSCDISTRPREARDEPVLDRIGDRRDDDRNGLRRISGGFDRAGYGDDDVDFQLDQLGGEIGQHLAIPRRRAVLDNDVLSHDVAKLAKTVHEGFALRGWRVDEGRQDEIADSRDAPWTLRRGRERQRENPDDEREDLP